MKKVSFWIQRTCKHADDFSYQTSADGFASVVNGVYSTYHGGGFAVELDHDLDSALEKVSELEILNWIDRYTRFAVLESTVFNVNSRLFSKLKTYFEISPAGQVISSHDTDSMRLYPYVDIVDYVTLVAQLLFIALTVVKFLFFIYSLTKCSFNSAAVFKILVELMRLLLALGYVVFYIWRIDRTIFTVEVLMNNKGE